MEIKVLGKAKWIIFILYILSLYAWLLLKDFPLPHGDDLFFVGTGVNYATTGEFKNPGAAEYMAEFSDIDRPYWFVPLYPRSLGMWLAVLGVSDLSVRLFTITCIMLTTLCLLLTIRRSKHISWMIWFIPLIMIFGHRWSLRPESLAILFLFSGFAIMSSEFKHTKLKSYLAYTLLGLSCITSQLFTLFCIPIIILYIHYITKAGPSNPTKRVEISMLALAFITVLAVFGFCIDWEFLLFNQMITDTIYARDSCRKNIYTCSSNIIRKHYIIFIFITFYPIYIV